jgi:hypothetical protein
MSLDLTFLFHINVKSFSFLSLFQGIELGAMHMLNKHFTNWATSPAICFLKDRLFLTIFFWWFPVIGFRWYISTQNSTVYTVLWLSYAITSRSTWYPLGPSVLSVLLNWTIFFPLDDDDDYYYYYFFFFGDRVSFCSPY